MPDEHAAEPPPGNPGQRALGAMESAVRRARETAGAPPLPHPPSPRARPAARPVDAAPPPGNDPLSDRPDRWLIRSVAVAAALVVAAAIALIVSLSSSSAPPSSTAAGGSHTSTAPPSTKGQGGASTSTTGSNTSTTVAVAPGGPPVISSLDPSSGSAGQSVTVAGGNFLSTSGQIVATFNGQVAPTSCPAQNTCTITVPSSTSPSAQVVITTSGGTSNAVTFTYG